MADQVRVFVSHHHSPEEDAFTARLVADLEAAGADVWVDVVGVGAADFQKRINEALASCNWFVLVLTPAAIASPWVEMEVHAAIRLKTQGRMHGIIQIMAKAVTQEQIPATWGIYAHFDSTQDYGAALGLTLHELGLSQPSLTLTPPPSQPVSPSYAAPPDRFPSRFSQLGYQIAFLNGAEVILPPVTSVHAGPFLMGSDPNKNRGTEKDEQPQHWVTLGSFQITTYPITVAEYACFVRAMGQAAPSSKDNWPLGVSWKTQLREHLDHPVVMVTWHNAVAYATWLSEHTGMGWRLPTEAEWEKAARWDTSTGIARVYPWGNKFDSACANTIEAKKHGTTPVDIYPSGASPYGVVDMAGNATEWTSSLYLPYPYLATDGREQAESSERRVLRGGSWNYYASTARAAHRHSNEATNSFISIGFRLVRSGINP